jgi:hypothetical protein
MVFAQRHFGEGERRGLRACRSSVLLKAIIMEIVNTVDEALFIGVGATEVVAPVLNYIDQFILHSIEKVLGIGLVLEIKDNGGLRVAAKELAASRSNASSLRAGDIELPFRMLDAIHDEALLEVRARRNVGNALITKAAESVAHGADLITGNDQLYSNFLELFQRLLAVFEQLCDLSILHLALTLSEGYLVLLVHLDRLRERDVLQTKLLSFSSTNEHAHLLEWSWVDDDMGAVVGAVLGKRVAVELHRLCGDLTLLALKECLVRGVVWKDDVVFAFLKLVPEKLFKAELLLADLACISEHLDVRIINVNGDIVLQSLESSLRKLMSSWKFGFFYELIDRQKLYALKGNLYVLHLLCLYMHLTLIHLRQRKSGSMLHWHLEEIPPMMALLSVMRSFDLREELQSVRSMIL